MIRWGAENRLIRVEPGKDPNDLVQGDKKLKFKYDYLGRRVEKKVDTHNGTSWNLSTARRLIHRGDLPSFTKGSLSRFWPAKREVVAEGSVVH
jgi:hypothetical protein